MSESGKSLTDAAPASQVAPTSVQPDGGIGGAAPEPKVEEPVKVDPPADTKPDDKVDDKSPLGDKAEPIKYEFKLPEGVTMDPAKLEAFSVLGNELKLDAPSAQKLMDLHATELKSALEAVATATEAKHAKAFETMIGDWKKGIESDPDLSGSNAEKAHTILGQVLDTYGSKEAREAFDLTGAGWNPHIVKMMLAMGKALTEGQPGPLGKPSVKTGPKTVGEIFYPSKN